MDTFLLLGTAAMLGLRHGIDWDHIAALVDISGVSASKGTRKHAMVMSLLYALGHAFIVTVLGIAAISFTAILPQWFDTIMERVVGVTLVILAGYLFYAVFQAAKTSTEVKLQSRWMLLISTCNHWIAKMRGRPAAYQSGDINAWSAFTIGILHGLGAETGTQVLLIAAVGGASTHGLSIAMLIAFVIGLLASNTAVAIISTSSFRSSSHLRPLYLFAGATAGVFSLFVGVLFVLGHADRLPDLQSFKFSS